MRSCKCFDVCSLIGLSHFLQCIPETVNTTSSPWFPYLKHVYKSRVPLPYPLSSVRMWYLQTDLIPMSSCRTHSGTAIYNWPDPYWQDLAEAPALPWCAPAECAIWYRDDIDSILRPQNITPITGGSYHIYSDLKHVDVGRALLVSVPSDIGQLVPGAYQSLHFPKQAMANEWIEVMRHGQGEQTGALGLWFKVAPGSGMWVNVGNTMHLVDDSIPTYIKEKCYHNHGVSENETHALRRGGQGPLSFYLYCAGYDSGQF